MAQPCPVQRFDEWLRQPQARILDGGLATQLELAGESLHQTLWSAALLHQRPAAIRAAHERYLEAGAELLITASYQASRAGFAALGLGAEEADALLQRSVRLAREATRAAHVPDALVAASVGPWGAVQHDGSEYTGRYAIASDELAAFHAQRLTVLAAARPDLLACETIPNRQEAQVLAELLHDHELPAFVSFCCRDSAHLSDGTPLAEVVLLFQGHARVRALGINCTAPQHVAALLHIMRDTVPDMPLLVYPNSGERYDAAANRWCGTATAAEVAAAANDWQQAGARAIGGCCRVGPEHIRALKRALRET